MSGMMGGSFTAGVQLHSTQQEPWRAPAEGHGADRAAGGSVRKNPAIRMSRQHTTVQCFRKRRVMVSLTPVGGGNNVGAHEGTMTGTIRTLRVDKGFGFIKDAGGKDYFFHQSAVQGEGINDLREGDSVEFEVGDGPKGPRAE